MQAKSGCGRNRDDLACDSRSGSTSREPINHHMIKTTSDVFVTVTGIQKHVDSFERTAARYRSEQGGRTEALQKPVLLSTFKNTIGTW